MKLFNSQKDIYNYLKSAIEPVVSERPKDTVPVTGVTTDQFYAAFGWWNRVVPYERKVRYYEYEEMDLHPLINAALDIYADDATSIDINNRCVTIQSNNKDIEDELYKLLYNVLDINNIIWQMMRQALLYGDSFYELIFSNKGKGIVGIQNLPPVSMWRAEENGILKGYIQDIQSMSKIFTPAQVVHIRILPYKNIFAPYGQSIIDPIRRHWRRLRLLEDAMVVYRLDRAPERRKFKVWVGNMTPSAAQEYIELQKQTFRKEMFYNERFQALDFRPNIMPPNEDFWLPVFKDGGHDIEILEGGRALHEINDVEYFENQILASLRIPRAYIINEGGSENRRQNLSQIDIHFARNVMRKQQFLLMGLYKIIYTHLALLDIDPMQYDIKLQLTIPGNIYEYMQLELLEKRIDIANSLIDMGVDKKYTFENIMKFSQEEIGKMIEQEYDTMPAGIGYAFAPGEEDEAYAGKEGEEEYTESPDKAQKTPTAKERKRISIRYIALNEVKFDRPDENELMTIREKQIEYDKSLDEHIKKVTGDIR